MAPLRLVSIAPSHYCEKARWALERAGVEFTETKHVPGLHLFVTKKLGEGTSCPKLVIQASDGEASKVLNQSTEILHFADSYVSEEGDRLYPGDEEARKVVEEWEKKFDDILGPHLRRWAYSSLLFHKWSHQILTEGASATEKRVAWLMGPVLRRGIAKGVGLNQPNAKQRSLERLQGIFKEVDDALADGRPFICGQNFTAADLTFASLGCICVAGAGIPDINNPDCPKDLADAVRGFQQTAAGKHILHLYKSERQKVVGSKRK